MTIGHCSYVNQFLGHFDTYFDTLGPFAKTSAGTLFVY